MWLKKKAIVGVILDFVSSIIFISFNAIHW